jgi:hypothetical protein
MDRERVRENRTYLQDTNGAEIRDENCESHHLGPIHPGAEIDVRFENCEKSLSFPESIHLKCLIY